MDKGWTISTTLNISYKITVIFSCLRRSWSPCSCLSNIPGNYSAASTSITIIIPIIYASGYEFRNGITSVTTQDDKKIVIDVKGTTIIENADIIYFYNNSKYALIKSESEFYRAVNVTSVYSRNCWGGLQSAPTIKIN